MARYTSSALACILCCILSCKEPSKSKTPPSDNQSEPAAKARSTDATPAPMPKHWVFDSPRKALEHVLADEPRILGIGELHKLTGSAPVDSALSRFTNEMIDALRGRATDLIVETWVADPNCGAKEKAVLKEVQITIQRPAQTENELVELLKRARALKIGRHVLEMSCEDHASLIPPGKTEVDFWKLLLLVTKRLTEKAQQLYETPNRMLVLYGGAHHNDLYPYDSLAEVSYVPALEKLSDKKYVELDLYVPELIPGNELLEKESWYPLLAQKTTHTQVVLIERGQRSYILLMRKAKRSKSR